MESWKYYKRRTWYSDMDKESQTPLPLNRPDVSHHTNAIEHTDMWSRLWSDSVWVDAVNVRTKGTLWRGSVPEQGVEQQAGGVIEHPRHMARVGAQCRARVCREKMCVRQSRPGPPPTCKLFGVTRIFAYTSAYVLLWYGDLSACVKRCCSEKPCTERLNTFVWKW